MIIAAIFILLVVLSNHGDLKRNQRVLSPIVEQHSVWLLGSPFFELRLQHAKRSYRDTIGPDWLAGIVLRGFTLLNSVVVERIVCVYSPLGQFRTHRFTYIT